VIVTEKLTKVYGKVRALDEVSISVAEGEVVALWGHNGAGKTTVIRCLLDLVSYSGVARIGGRDATAEGKEARRLVGYVPQELSFFDDLGVRETLAFSAGLRRVPTDRIDVVLDRVGLVAESGKLVGALSGGMKQRLAIALALLPDPPVFLLDEPTSNLDAASRESVLELLHDLKTPRRSMLLTSHHLEEVGILADRAVIMEHGRVVLEAPPSELAERLGIRSWLHVVVDPNDVDRALDELSAAGFDASRNARGVLVEVPALQKTRALDVIAHAGIPARDFEVWR